MQEKFEALRAQFDSSLVKHRMGQLAADQQSAVALPYVDSHVVEQRLNDVLGVTGWQTQLTVSGIAITCRLSILVDGHWLQKEDGSAISDAPPDRREIAVKAAMSDAFKRAAAQWGVGRYLYQLPVQHVPVKTNASGRLELDWDSIATETSSKTEAASSTASTATTASATTASATAANEESAPAEEATVAKSAAEASESDATAKTVEVVATPTHSEAETYAFEVKGAKGMVGVPASIPASDHERIKMLIPRITNNTENAAAVDNYRRYLDDPSGKVKPFMSEAGLAFLHATINSHVASAVAA